MQLCKWTHEIATSVKEESLLGDLAEEQESELKVSTD